MNPSDLNRLLATIRSKIAEQGTPAFQPSNLFRSEVREIDHRAINDFGVPGVVLMENAGRSAAELLLLLGVTGRVVICCGKGNNGGDGFVMARHLDIHNVAVIVLLFANPEELSADAAVNFRIIERYGVALTVQPDLTSLTKELSEAEWVVDALFGTGLAGAVRQPFDQIITAMNASAKPILAIDIPSGLDCDTGQPLGPTIRAAHTLTFVAPKFGFTNPAAKEWLGEIHVANIGVSPDYVALPRG
jgi:NAD(P)H-hydrate epimerase